MASIAPTFEWCSDGIRRRWVWKSPCSVPRGRNWRKIGGGYSGGYSNWIFIFGKLDIQNSCPSIPCEGGGNEPKNGVKCRKLTLSVQLFQGCNMAGSPINRGVRVYLDSVWVGGIPLMGTWRGHGEPWMTTLSQLKNMIRNSKKAISPYRGNF